MKQTSILIILTLLFLGGCTSFPTNPDNLVQNIESYQGKTVRVRGTVNNTIHIPGTQISIYQLMGKELGIIVLSPVRRQNNLEITIGAKVFLLANSQSGEVAISDVQDFTQMLKDQEILSGALIDATSRLIMEAIRVTAKIGQNIYFLVEEQKVES